MINIGKLTYRILFITSVAAVLNSCSDKLHKESIEQPGAIRIAACTDGTKALLNSADITTGTQIMLYDILSDDSHYHNIDGKIATYGSPVWSIQDEPLGGYSWMYNTQRFTHNFFGWLTKDKDGLMATSLFGAGRPNVSDDGAGTMTMSVPMTVMNLQTTQFDFCYSDIIARDVHSADYSIVNIPMQHLFSAFGVKIHNYTAERLTVSSIKVYNVANRKSARVVYNTNTASTSVTYTTDAVKSSWASAGTALELVKNATPLVVNPDAEIANAITTTNIPSSTQSYFLMWPQTAEDLQFNGFVPETNNLVNSSDAYLEVTYAYGSGAAVTEKVSLIPRGAEDDFCWRAGDRHMLELAFSDKTITLSVQVLDWDYYESEIDYAGEVSVNDEGRLRFRAPGVQCTVDEENKLVYFKGGNPITCDFTILAPLNGTWMVSKNGDFDAFEIDNVLTGTYGDGIENNTGNIDGNQATFTIYPKVIDPSRDYKITLSFAVRTSSGRAISAELVQPEVYTIILQAS